MGEDEAVNQDGSARDRSTRADARDAFDALTETIWRLRQPDGCPWDRKQTHASIGKNLIEEAYEALDCIEAGDARHLREELGDVLMQVMLHAQIAADAGEFTIRDVVEELDDKLVRRHPHVFGEHAKAGDAEEVLAIWDSVKLAEKAERDKVAVAGAASGAAVDGKATGAAEGVSTVAEAPKPEGLLDSVPRSLPALMQAQKVSRKAAAVGFEWETVADVWDKVEEERREFLCEEPGSPERALEFGDMMFAMVNIARKEGIDAESALRASCAKFRERWVAIEGMVHSEGRDVSELTSHELEVLWSSAKDKEKQHE